MATPLTSDTSSNTWERARNRTATVDVSLIFTRVRGVARLASVSVTCSDDSEITSQ